jgi:hypothetical protein
MALKNSTPLAIRKERIVAPERVTVLPWDEPTIKHIASWVDMTPREVHGQLLAGREIRTDFSKYSILPEFRGLLVDIVV